MNLNGQSAPNASTPTSHLDDPIAFADKLSQEMGGADLLPLATLDAAAERHSQRCAQLGALLADHPEARAILTAIENDFLSVGLERYQAGIAFGASAEYLRRTVIADQDRPA